MSVRFAFLTLAGAIVALGLSVAAVSLSQGLIDQAIAFAWPSLGAALATGIAWPAVRSSTTSA